jgi:hypothetical protein
MPGTMVAYLPLILVPGGLCASPAILLGCDDGARVKQWLGRPFGA